MPLKLQATKARRRRRRLLRQLALSNRVRELREARDGIDYTMHPEEWDAIDADLTRAEGKLRELLEKGESWLN